ncbi:cytidylyltransferase domain-containing protein [Paenibacillus dendritiformis]|uniref:cytidylyltransferase domain-containing protein n=1 Tax=Paenibacillus dendritiformis TaxID=130049 RepID=UPI000DAA7B60|nr:glycosyltransferase family protein [Paenibacillus dendritiformis]PZM67284.1 acylneuraminate cytidylyltransferase [Paenibacillus dendritiformis]
MPRVVAIVQARMGSSRLPGKVLKPLIDHSVLGHVILRLKAVNSINEIIIATTQNPEDDSIISECNKYNVPVYRGSTENVLSRYYEAAQKFNADIVVRVTSDCPLVDPGITGNIIKYFFELDADYVSNKLIETFPRGLDTEVFTMSSLEKAYEGAYNDIHREHVTPYLYLHPDKFKLFNYSCEKDYSAYRWTLDTNEDYQLIELIYKILYEPNKIFTWLEIIHLMEDYPELKKINSHVKQKQLGE